MDGFYIWKYLFEDKVIGIIRGDHGFGRPPVNDPVEVRRWVGTKIFSDISLKSLEEFGLEKQTWPENLRQRENESLATWRDRLVHEVRIPIVLAALTDLKCVYVEVINPLLARRIVEEDRKLPDSLRTSKFLFRKIVRSLSPEIEFAKPAAEVARKDIFKLPQVLNLVARELDTASARVSLSNELIDNILKNITVSQTASAKKTSIKSKLRRLRRTVAKQKMDYRKKIDYNELAFRAYLIERMNRILSEDALAIRQQLPTKLDL